MRSRNLDKQNFTHLTSQSSHKPLAITIPSPPNFADFQFSRIGQPAELLKRLTEPDSQLQNQSYSPTPSPRVADQVLPPNIGGPLSLGHRQPLLQALLYSEPSAIMDSNDTSRLSQLTNSSLNAINATGNPVATALTVDNRLSGRRSSDIGVPSSSSRENGPLNNGPNEVLPSQHHPVSLAHSQLTNPLVSSDATPMVPRLQIDSPTSVTACEDLADRSAISPLPKSTFEQLQSRLSLALTTLTTLSTASLPFSITTPALTVAPLSATAHVLHHAQHTAQVAVKGATASIDIAKTMHTIAQHSQDATLRSLELAQQSLAAAQAAHAAAEQSSAGAHASLVGARGAQERANEAVDAVERVKAVLDAQEQDLARREARVRDVVVDTRSIVEEIRAWAAELEQERIRDKERRKSWGPDDREKEGRRQLQERRLTGEESDSHLRRNDRDRRQSLSSNIFGGQEVVGQATTVVSANSRQPDQPQSHFTSENEALRSAETQNNLATVARSQDDKEREEQLRRAQEKRRQEVTMEKERARLAAGAKIRAERARQMTGEGDASTGQAAPDLTANVAASGTANISVSPPAVSAATNLTAVDRPSQHQATSIEVTSTDNSNALRSKFIPASTEAGRLVQTDMPFSSIALASENGKSSAANNNQPEQDSFMPDTSPLSELSSDDAQDAGPEKRSLVHPDSSGHLSANPVSNVVHECSPMNTLPTWTVLKRECSLDISECEAQNAGKTTELASQVSIGSTPPAPPHIEQVLNLRHLADAGGVDFRPTPSQDTKVKLESVLNDTIVLPPRKVSRAGLFPGTTLATRSIPGRDASTARSQPQPSLRSVSPVVSTESDPSHVTQVGIPPPRMKKFDRTKASTSHEPVIAGNGRTVVDNDNSETNVAANTPVVENAREIPDDNDDVLPQITPVSYNGRGGPEDDGARYTHASGRRTPDIAWGWNNGDARAVTPVPRTRHRSDNQDQSEYMRNDGYRGSTAQHHDGLVRGNGRWLISGRTPSPNSQWGDSSNHHPSVVRRDSQHQGNIAVSSAPRSPSSRFPRLSMYRRHADHYSPSSSPPIYGRAQTTSRPLPTPTSPQMGSRKRLREDSNHQPSSGAPPSRALWTDDSDGRRSGPWQASPDVSPSSRSRRTPSLTRTLASRMQEPGSLLVDAGPIDSHNRSDSRISAPYRPAAAAAKPRDDQHAPSQRSSLSDREHEYERDMTGSGKRKKYYQDSYGTDYADGDRPHLLARMSDQARSPVRGLGSPIRGLSSTGRGYDRGGRGIGRGRGSSFRGGYRSLRAKPLQDRIH